MIFILLLFCFCQEKLLAQNPNKKIDSLLIILKTANEDTNKVNSLIALSEQLWKRAK